MGGTFDPIHMGHLILGEQSYEQFQLDKVLFMPSATRPINGTVLAEPLITSVWIWSGLQLKIIPILSCLLQKCTRPGIPIPIALWKS